MSLQESNSQLHQILLCLSERWGGGRASDIVKAESSRKDPRATGGLVSNLPHLRVNKTKQHLLESLKTCLAAKFVGSWHCAASFSLQVPKSCTDLDPTLLYILILRTYTKFVRKLVHGHFKKGIASVASQLQSLIENEYYHYLLR